MIEVEVAGLEDSHHLQTFGGLAVEGDGGGVDELGDQALEGGGRDEEIARCDEVGETVQEGVHAEEGLLVEWGALRCGDMADE